MKTPSSSLLAVFAVLNLSAFDLNAQLAPKPPNPGARDPFHKERGAPTTAPNFSDNLVTLTTIFESYALNREDAVSILTAPPDADARYRRVTELVTAGRARLEDVQASAGKSGQRGLIEDVDVLQLPSQFHPPLNSDEPALPAALQQAQFGDRLEFEPILGNDGRACNLSFSISAKRLLGFAEFRAGRHAQPQPAPTTENREIVSSLTLRVGDPILLGTRNQPPAAGAEAKEMGVVFARVLVSKERPEAALPPAGPVGYAEHLVSVYSMDRAAARDVLIGESKPGACFQAVQALVGKKQAKLEHVLSLSTQAGMHAKTDENIVQNQPGGSSPAIGLSAPLRPRVVKDAPDEQNAMRVPFIPAMSGKNLGLSLEIESIIGPPDAALKGTPLIADINFSLWWRMDAGVLKGPPALALYPETDVAEWRKIQNAISCYTGVPALLGTLNPPRDTGVNGRKDTGRAWLVFIQVTPVKP